MSDNYPSGRLRPNGPFSHPQMIDQPHSFHPPGHAEARVRTFLTLEPGWHFGGGLPANPFAVDTALILIEGLRKAGYTEIRGYPRKNGEVLVVADKDGKTIEIECRDDSEE